MAANTPVPSLPPSTMIIEPTRRHAMDLEFDCVFSDDMSESRKYLDHIVYDYDLIQGKGNARKTAQYIVTLLL